MRWIPRLLALALFVGALYVGWRFAAENGAPVRVHFVVGEVDGVALWKVLLVTFAAGAACAGLGWIHLFFKNLLTSHRYKKMLGGLESEIHQLRNLPLAPDSAPPGDTPAVVAEEPPARGSLGRGT